MIIKYLKVKNFGCFRGEITLDCLPTDDGARSIVLVGGDNGSGKTTLLNAIKLCLYGRRCDDLWTGGQSGYRHFIARKFSNPAFADGQREITLELGLLVWEKRIAHELTVRRTFQLTDNRLFLNENQESLEVFRDGTPLDIPEMDAPETDRENQYDQLLRILIPRNFAQFYFFDGERVRELFDRPTAENTSQAIKDLLGLSQYENLGDDLKKYRQSKLPTLYGKHRQKTAELEQKQGEQKQLQAQKDLLEAELHDLQEQLQDIETALLQKEKEFIEKGGIHQKELDELKEQERQCNLEYDKRSQQLKEALSDHIAVCFLLPLQKDLDERLARERSRREWLIKRNTIEPHVSTLVEKLFGPKAPQPIPPLTSAQFQFFSARLAEEVKSLFWPPPPNASKDIWFDLREAELETIKRQLEEALYFSSASLRDIVEAKSRIFSQRQRIQEKLNSMGDDSFTREIAEEIKQLYEKRGELAAKEKDLKAKIEHQEKLLSEISGQLTNLLRESEKSAKGHEKEEVSKRVEEAVREYIQQASVKRADEIERHLNRLFLDMSNCRDVIRKIKLDRQTYKLQLIDIHGRERLIETGLSAGQSQVLAMSFVGALAKASGRILPFIIDTPLGRLDVNHRRDVTEKFFIGQSPQTILLSTPTEINNCVYDQQQLYLLDLLSPHVSHVYTLTNAGPDVTEIDESYFGNHFNSR